MPAKNIQRINRNGVYSHVHNRGIAGTIIFNDQKDYETFLGYLKDYLTPPGYPDLAKKTFTVRGNTFRGIPHQPKNYFDQVELVAYSLRPDHFHLLLHQKTRGSLEKLMRSLCTRYSMYFNKKYQRTGSLFEGPYKSVQINGVSRLLHLTRYFHYSPKESAQNLSANYSSYPEYLGERKTPWVKPIVVMSFFDKSENDSFKGTDGYRNFVENYKPDQKEEKLLAGITIEKKSEHLEGRVPEHVGSELSREIQPEPDLKRQFQVPLFSITATAVFLLLLGLGIKNIKASAIKKAEVSQPPQVSGVEVEEAEEVKPEPIVVIIKISDGAESVNIREGPTTKSPKVGEAKDGETFEFVSVDSGWYQIKLDDGLTGFISARYAEIEGDND